MIPPTIAIRSYLHSPLEMAIVESPLMITVYKIIPDVNTFQNLETDDVDWGVDNMVDGSPVADDWDPPKDVYSRYPKKPTPDIWSVFGMPCLLAYSHKAYGILGTFLEATGELLLLDFEGEELLVHNVTYVLNCVDKKKWREDPGDGSGTKYAFLPQRMDYSPFMVPQTAGSELYAVEGYADRCDEYKAVIEDEGLTGLEFREVWCTDEG